jgi:hypothetical protein
MMQFAIEQLLRSGTAPIIAGPVNRDEIEVPGSRGDELASMLALRNGFYAYQYALHIFSCGVGNEPDVRSWNSNALWRHEFGDLAADHFFFAEDAFGFQFTIKNDRIWSFDPETAHAEELAADLEGWASTILDDPAYYTGCVLANEWQQKNGPLSPGKRLAPKMPFVAGGEFSVGNLALVDSVELMRFRGSLANQIKDLPDGTAIQFKIAD